MPRLLQNVRRREFCAIYRTSLLALLCSSLVLGQANLPPAVQADLLRDQIYAEAKANDSDAVIRSIDQYKKLVSDNQSSRMVFPMPLLWIEAKAAHDSGDATRALQALGDFLANTDKSSDQYKKALALYPKYQQDAAGAKEQQTDVRRQAMAARIPEVIASMIRNLVTVPAGQMTTKGQYFFDVRDYNHQYVEKRTVNVNSFLISRDCVTELWWEVFLADTGRDSPDAFKLSADREKLTHFVSDRQGQVIDDPSNQSPADFVARFDIDKNDFIKWVSAHSRVRWRLPSESELTLIALQMHDFYHHSGHGPCTDCQAFETKIKFSDDLAFELVQDCWHSSFAGSPKDGRTWTTECEDPQSVALHVSTELMLFNVVRASWPKQTFGRLTFRLASDK